MPEIRPARPGDFPAIGQVFYDAVHGGTGAHYSAAQRHVWAPEVPREMAARLEAQAVLVAADPAPVGFASLRADGYLDFLFVHPDRTGEGIARRLVAAVEAIAMAQGLTRLTTLASDVARPVLEHMGWQAGAENHVEKQGILLRNWPMLRVLTAGEELSRV